MDPRRKAKLPDNVTPENSRLKDPEERARIATRVRSAA